MYMYVLGTPQNMQWKLNGDSKLLCYTYPFIHFADIFNESESQ